jgi:hypothetical protein
LLSRGNGVLTAESSHAAVSRIIEKQRKNEKSAAVLRCLDSSARRKTMCRQSLASEATRERSSLYLAIRGQFLSASTASLQKVRFFEANSDEVRSRSSRSILSGKTYTG